MTKFPDLFAALAAPFETHEVKIRPAQGGRQLHYITARTAMNRLDGVLGPENWWDEYLPSENSVLCRLSLRLPDGSVVTKCDAGGYAGMADQGDDDKSGFSDAFKRACAKFGVARYLYRDGVPQFVRDREPAVEPPAMPAEPAGGAPAAATNGQAPAQGNGSPGGKGGNVPRTGKALFAWTKEMEQRHEVGLLKYLNGWAKLQEFPGRMIDWDAEQVAMAYQEATRKIQSIQSSRNEAMEEAMASAPAPPEAQAPGGGAESPTLPGADLDSLRDHLAAARDVADFRNKVGAEMRRHDPRKTDTGGRRKAFLDALAEALAASPPETRVPDDATADRVVELLWDRERRWLCHNAAVIVREWAARLARPAVA